jgi:hypothetical protein
MQANTPWKMLTCSSAVRDRHLGIRPVSQLNTWPMVSPVNASRLPSRAEPRASLGVGWLARPSPWRTFTSYSLPASWRTPLGVRFARREAPPRTAALPPTAERLTLAERLYSGSCPDLKRCDSPPCRSRSRQCDSKRVATQDHERDQPPDCLFGVGVGADQLGDIADRRRFGLDLPPLWRSRRPVRP